MSHIITGKSQKALITVRNLIFSTNWLIKVIAYTSTLIIVVLLNISAIQSTFVLISFTINPTNRFIYICAFAKSFRFTVPVAGENGSCASGITVINVSLAIRSAY